MQVPSARTFESLGRTYWPALRCQVTARSTKLINIVTLLQLIINIININTTHRLGTNTRCSRESFAVPHNDTDQKISLHKQVPEILTEK